MPPRQDTTAWGTEPGLPTTEEGRRILESVPWPPDTSEPSPGPEDFARRWGPKIQPPPEPTIKDVPKTPDKPGGQVATVNGRKIYIEGSLMRDVYGFETPLQYVRAQLRGTGQVGRVWYGPLAQEPRFIGTEEEYQEYLKDYKALEGRIGAKQAWIEGQNRMIERQEKQYTEALVALKPYRAEGNMYDLSRAIADKIPESHLNILFGEDVVRQYRQPAQYQPAQPEKEKVSLPKTIWRLLTPWAEENGETFLSYVKGALQRYVEGAKASIDRTPIDQETLRAEYQAQENQPLWMRIIFGSTLVVKDPKDDKYYRVIASEPPLISPATGPTKLAKLLVDRGAKKLPQIIESTAKPAIKLLTPEDLGISEAQFTRLLKTRIDALGKTVGASKEETTTLLEKLIQEKRLVEASRLWASQKLGVDITKLNTKEYLAMEKAIEKMAKEAAVKKYVEAIKANMVTRLKQAATRGDQEAIKQLKALGMIRQATTTEARAVAIPGRLTYSRMQEILNEYSQQQPSVALKNMVDSKSLVPIMAANPELVARILSQATPEARKQALAEMSSTMARAITSGDLATAQTQAISSVQATTKAGTMSKADIKAAVTSSLAQTQPLTMPWTAEKTATRTATETPVTAPAMTISGELAEPKPRLLPRPRLRGNGGGMLGKEDWKPSYAPSAIAWKQGKLHGEGFYYVIAKTGPDKYSYFTFSESELPAGVKPMPFARTRESFQKLGKRIPRQLNIDMGIVDVKAGHSLDFTGDPEQQTKGDITIGGVRIQEVKPTIVGGGRDRTTTRRRNNGIIRKPRIKDLGMGIVQEGRRRHLRLV